jgi:hypothetical protein
MTEPTKPKQILLENPVSQPLDRFLLMLDKVTKTVSLCQVTIPAQSTVDLAELCPSIASGRETAQRIGRPGITAEEAIVGFMQLFGSGELATITSAVPGVYLARDGAIVGNRASDQMTVTIVVEDRQPRADGKQYIRDELLTLPPRSERSLPENDRCLYVLPGDAEPEDIQKVLAREWEVVGEVTKDGTVKKKRERKKDVRKAQRQAKSG